MSESGTVQRSRLDSLLANHQDVVLGLPLSMSGNYSTQTFEVIKFGLELRKRGKRVWFVDERLTTRLAKTYGKRDDDRFSAEALLLEFIQNPDIATQLIERQVEKCGSTEFEKRKNCAIIDVPPSLSVECAGDDEFGIGYSRDPFVAYSLHRAGFFVYRVWENFVEALAERVKQGRVELVIANSDLLDDVSALNLGVPTVYCKVIVKS